MKTWVGRIGCRFLGQDRYIEARRNAIRYMKRNWTLRLITSPFRMLPNFLIIGAQKGGTTSLYWYLAQHPNVRQAMVKEVNYFNKNYMRTHLWYRAYFPVVDKRATSANVVATGEATPEYLLHPYAAKRAYSLLPKAKIIVMLRNPIDRAFSNYRALVHNAGEEQNFMTVLQEGDIVAREELARIFEEPFYWSAALDRSALLLRGLYAEQLERWLSLFPKTSIHIIKSEDFFGHPREIVADTLHFLGLSSLQYGGTDVSFEVRNQGEGRYYQAGELSWSDREWLARYYSPFNERLYELIGRDLGWE